MKKNVVIVALSILLFLGHVSAQEQPNYVISEDKKTITVYRDCVINVAEFAPQNVNIYGEKEKGGWGKKKGVDTDFFKEKSETLNNKPSGVSFKKNRLSKDGIAQIEINYQDISDNLKLEFYQAEEKVIDSANNKKDWFVLLSQTFAVNLKKGVREAKEVSKEAPPTVEIKSGEKVVQPEPIVIEKTGIYLPLAIISWVLLLLVMAAALLAWKKKYVVLKFNEDEPDEDINPKKEKEDSTNDSPQSLDNKTLNELKFIKSKMEILVGKIEKIEKVGDNVYELLRKMAEEISCIAKNSDIASSDSDTNNKHSVTPNEIDTEIVQYTNSSNSFTIGGANDNIFRIYSKNGNYFYTIVNDEGTRRELKSILTSNYSCISFEPSQGNQVVPVKPGQLIRLGENEFRVDDNHKLVVKCQ